MTRGVMSSPHVLPHLCQPSARVEVDEAGHAGVDPQPEDAEIELPPVPPQDPSLNSKRADLDPRWERACR